MYVAPPGSDRRSDASKTSKLTCQSRSNAQSLQPLLPALVQLNTTTWGQNLLYEATLYHIYEGPEPIDIGKLRIGTTLIIVSYW